LITLIGKLQRYLFHKYQHQLGVSQDVELLSNFLKDK